jgi:protocatechuate 4,5-dioxygenase beta chain
VAELISGLTTSHVPAVGAAIDLGKTQEPYWKPVFQGFDFTKQWITEQNVDVIILVYNDHATAFPSRSFPPSRWVVRRSFHPPMRAGGRGRCRW